MENLEAMEIVLACGLALLESTFIMAGLLILHGLRGLIGKAAFYLSVGSLLVFTQLVSATELRVVLGFPAGDFHIAQTVLFLPYLAVMLVVYVTEGTLAAQRLIIGAMATLGFYVYLSYLTAAQCEWSGYAISQGPTADSLDYLLRQSQRAMAGSIIAQAIDLFLIPIFFQRLRNLGSRMFFAVVGALLLTQIIDNFVYVTVIHWGSPHWWYQINSSYMAKSALTVWLGIFATIYITRIEREIPGEGRNAMDIVLAFFGGYGKAQSLQQEMRGWVDRYRLVVENASDMILLLNRDGKILDANFAARRMLQKSGGDSLADRLFPAMINDKNGEALDWNKLRDKSIAAGRATTGLLSRASRFECHLDSPERGKLELDVAVSGLAGVDGEPLLVVIARDITERNRLERERQALSEQLSHKQRLESIGQLAGGVAHDFNNYLHAIQGQLDLITYMHDIEDEEVAARLDKIDDMVQRSARLTQQLLGFARKGNFREETIDLADLLRKTVELFIPNTQEGMEFSCGISENPMFVRGDFVQLQQVFLNILLNARDAVKRSGRETTRVELSADYANNQDFSWKPPSPNANPDDYLCARFRDNGTGIDEDTLGHIFEPFFTTKPRGEGTGMGLAMAYGAIINHRGWISVESRVGEGTDFLVFLPKHVEQAPSPPSLPTETD